MAALSASPAAGAGAAAEPRLRVLVIDEAPPFPPDSGKRLRTWHLLRRLARQHDVALLCYDAPERTAEARSAALAALAEAGIACHTVAPPPELRGLRLYLRLLANCFSPWPYSVSKHHRRRFRRALRQLCRTRHFDLLQIEWTPYAAHVFAGAPPHLIASHNIEAQIWRRRAQVSGSRVARFYFNGQAAKMERFERRAFRRARAVTVVSPDDRALAQRMGAGRSRIVANGVDLDHFRPHATSAAVPDRLVFLGALDWFPNQDAVAYFVSAMLPLIQARRPQVELKIVGRRPPESLRRLSGAGVELVGEVDDVRPLLASAAVVVVPLRVGGGSRIKIIEALAMEKAVVSTSVGAEGLELHPGVHLQIADTPQQFARLTLELLNAPEQAASLGRAGARWVREHHSWDDCARALEAEWRCAVGASLTKGGRPAIGRLDGTPLPGVTKCR